MWSPGHGADRPKQPNPTSFQRFAPHPPTCHEFSGLKAAFCLAGDGNALLSQHLGDLDELKNQNAWRQALGLYRSLFDTKPDLIVPDRNPGYRSTQLAMELARETAARFVQVQHHHAHLASCLAQHGRAIDAPPVLGIILDGLGYGDDGTIWGGEFLLGGYRGFRRLAYFEPVAMPGGDKASLEPWRNAYAHLRAAFGPDFLAKLPADGPFVPALAEKPLRVLDRMIERGVNAPLASSAGRLFDACAAVLGICLERQSYEGQAGMEMKRSPARSWMRPRLGQQPRGRDRLSPGKVRWRFPESAAAQRRTCRAHSRRIGGAGARKRSRERRRSGARPGNDRPSPFALRPIVEEKISASSK